MAQGVAPRNYYELCNFLGDRGSPEAHASGLELLTRFGVLLSIDEARARLRRGQFGPCTRPGCGEPINAVEATRGRGVGWRLRCFNRHSVEGTSGTIFMHLHVQRAPYSFGTMLEVMYNFVIKTKIVLLAEEMRVPKKTVIFWYRQLRLVMWALAKHQQEERWLGELGDIIEVDESQIHKAKAGVGRLSRAQRGERWVVGGISRTTKMRFADVVVRRDRNTIMNILRWNIHPDSWICSDMWGAYNRCRQFFRGHGKVNHSRNFVNPPRNRPPHFNPIGFFNMECLDQQWYKKRANRMLLVLNPNHDEPVRWHTQRVERNWRELKKRLLSVSSELKMKVYIGEYLYRSNILDRHPGNKFHKFLRDVGDCCPGPTLNPKKGEDCRCRECF